MAAASIDTIGNLTFGHLLGRHAAAHPDKTFLVWDAPEDRRIALSWADVAGAVATARDELASLGVGAGDCFCIHARNRPETVALLFAAAALGAAIVPTNTRLTAHELAYVLRHSRAATVFTEPALHAVAIDAIADAGVTPRVVDLGTYPDDDRLCGHAGLAATPNDGDNDRIAAVLYTSGTTADPKGVCISEAALLHAGLSIAHGIGFGESDSNFAALPLFHVNSLCYTLMTALVTGGAVVLADRFSASHYFRQVAETGATYGWMAATPMRMLLAQPPRATDRAHSMRRVVFGQNLTAGEFDDWQARFGVPLQQIYGMTETVMLPLMTPLFGTHPRDAVGHPALGVEVRVVADSQADAEPGEPGELWLRLRRGRQMMSGYLHDDEASAAAFTDGWFRTGDYMTRDALGAFRFVDRKRDVLKVSGENVSASEVERVLNEFPAVFDSAVVGRTDPLKGQVIVAYVVPADGAQIDVAELCAWCRARLASFKVPVTIEVRAEFPRTSAGKIRKSLL